MAVVVLIRDTFRKLTLIYAIPAAPGAGELLTNRTEYGFSVNTHKYSYLRIFWGKA